MMERCTQVFSKGENSLAHTYNELDHGINKTSCFGSNHLESHPLEALRDANADRPFESLRT